MKLYHDHNAVCCQKVELALFEKKIAYDEIIVSLFNSEQYSFEYLKINPRGIVPTIVDNGNTIIESTVICEYIDDAYSGNNLMPDEPFDKATARVWMKLVDEEIHEAGSTLSFCAMFRDRMLSMPLEEREKRYVNVGNPIREEMYRSSVDMGVDAPVAFRAIASYEMMIRDLEAHLSKSVSKWIAGAHYSLADLALTPYFARIEYLGLIELWTTGRPSVMQWWNRVKDRESFREVFTSALSPDDIDRMRSSGARIYDRVKERREEYLAANVKAVP